MYHYARLIELLYGLEKLAELTDDPELYSDEVRVKTEGTPRSATAHVEALRGMLIHDYKVDANGIVERANLLVATQQNIAAINETVGLAAQTFMDQPDPLLLNAIEFEHPLLRSLPLLCDPPHRGDEAGRDGAPQRARSCAG